MVRRMVEIHGPGLVYTETSPEHQGAAGGDPAEGLRLLGCFQGDLNAAGCGSLSTQLTAYFQHK